MEGIGSRTGRPSSRYGSTPVFTGPVRRWHKQWVNVSSSSSYVSYNNNNNSSNSNVNNNNSSSSNNNNNNNNVSSIRIRRWTPVQSARTGGESEPVEERPKRKVRYAPIVVLEGKKKEAEKGDVDVKEASKTDQSPAKETSENDDNEKKSSDDVLAAKSQASPQKSGEPTNDLNNRPMDLDTGGDNDNEDREDRDLGGDNKVADWVKAAQRGFAR